MKKIFKLLKKIHYMHYVASAITLGFVALAVFVFPSGIIRIWESLQDLFWSICYYGNELMDLGLEVEPTVNNFSVVPWTPIWGLPATWEEFVVIWDKYWALFVTSDNFFNYLKAISIIAQLAAPILTLMIVFILLLFMMFQKYLSTHNNDYNKDSPALRVFKLVTKYTYIPIKNWIGSFIAFINENSIYKKLWLLIWCYNFNVITIVIEFFAYYFYFVISFDILNLYRQVYKLLCDISVVIAFVPLWVWCVVGLWGFDNFRKTIAYQILYWHEAHNCGFIKERSITSMACGTMGSNKTTMITDMALLQEKMFREKALELMIENDMKFPQFPWINLENFMKHAIRKHIVYNLATIRRTMQHLQFCFYTYHTSDIGIQRVIRKHLKKRYGLEYENCIFGYDFERYGLEYDDKLKLVDIWSVLSAYAQEYFIYAIKCSLIISNYSIRTDSIIDDVGNFPLRDDDFYRRNSASIYEVSRYSKIIDYDAMRLGKKFNPDNPKKDSFEFGVTVDTEKGKERKNNLQLQELKRKDEGVNQKNDGYNDHLKIRRHSGTIDYFPFVKDLSDEQRPESLGADARDLYDIMHIRSSSDTKLALPLFALEELMYTFFYDKFVSLYLKYRFVRGDNTLLMYLLKKLIVKLQKYYKDTYNLFGYKVLKIQIERGTLDGEMDDKIYYLDNKRIYSDRFSTDAYSDFFTTKALRSKVGIEDLDEYKSTKATVEELQMQNSYFVADLMNKQENDK